MAIKASNQVSLTDVTDAYSVTLTSETFTFMGNSTSGAQIGLSCSTQVIAYCGTQQCSEVNVGTIQCPTGISATITNNNTSLPTITFTTIASITEACEATIPVTVDDVTFNKVFSFAVATSVDDSVLELYLQKTETGELKSMIEGIADTINITSRGGLNLSGDRFSLDSTNTKISTDGIITTIGTDTDGSKLIGEISAGRFKVTNTDKNSILQFDGSGLKNYSITEDDKIKSKYMLFSTETQSSFWLYNNNNGMPVAGLQASNAGGGYLTLTRPAGSSSIIISGGESLFKMFDASSNDTITLDGSTGTIWASGEIINSHSNVFRMTYGGNKSTLIRFDGNHYWLLFSDTSTGNYNSLRPLYINASTGLLASNNGQSFSGGTSINGNLSVSGSISTSKIQTTSNGNTDNVKIGDDCYIGDCNTANCIGLKGNQNNALGYIRFGSGGPTFGYDGSNLASSIPLRIKDGLEIYHSSTPYIDFHYGNSSADYTSRLVEGVSGSIYLRIPGGHGWFHAAGYAVDSSKHVKTNIKDITDEEALKLLDLRTVSFDYKNGQTNKRGMIAEEVMDVYPELVQVPDGYDEDTFEYDEEGVNIVPSLDYAGFVPYLIKMVQIQQREINELKTELSKKSV